MSYFFEVHLSVEISRRDECKTVDSGSAEPVSQLSRQEDIQLIEGKEILQLQQYSINIKSNSCYVFDVTVEDLTPVMSS
jgi:hypothetical protein